MLTAIGVPSLVIILLAIGGTVFLLYRTGGLKEDGMRRLTNFLREIVQNNKRG